MRVLFDQGTPAPLRRFLAKHTVSTVFEVGWSTLENGDLLRTAEENGYELPVTTDQNLKYQQNLKARKIALVVLLSTSWPRIEAKVEGVVRAVDASFAGSYAEVAI